MYIFRIFAAIISLVVNLIFEKREKIALTIFSDASCACVIWANDR